MKCLFHSRVLVMAVCLCITRNAALFGQESVRIRNTAADAYTMIERSGWSRYDNGSYSGHLYRELRAPMRPQGGEGAFTRYQGTVIVLEETLRDMKQSARGVDAVIPVSFRVSPNGGIQSEQDTGFPALRGFPAYPDKALSPGVKWTAPGSRTADPLHEGPVSVPFIAEYEYRGMEEYQGVMVHRLFAKYAVRYEGTKHFSRLEGTHAVDVLVRASDGLPVMMRDLLDETYSWPGGKTVRFKGFTLTFNVMAAPLEKEAIAVTFNPQDNIDLRRVPEGLKLTMRDIHFVPDSWEFLPEEKGRLDLIAEALRQIPGNIFLVEGHTADVGNPAGEMELSIQRARRLTDELAARGVGAGRFLYKGWGGTKPIGDNASEEGRRLNRRVEITILD